MQIINLPFSSAVFNTSLQVGDIAYYANPSPTGGFSVSNNDPITKLGTIVAINGSVIQVLKPNGVATPVSGSYIMFEKNKKVNSSNLTGYYAEVKFKNYSPGKVELFSIGSEAEESSK